MDNFAPERDRAAAASLRRVIAARENGGTERLFTLEARAPQWSPMSALG